MFRYIFVLTRSFKNTVRFSTLDGTDVKPDVQLGDILDRVVYIDIPKDAIQPSKTRTS
jgi:hypothetical protein